MKTILINNWKTGLMGLLLIGAGLYTGLTSKQSWTESGPIIVAGIGLVFSKDAQKNPGELLKNTLIKNSSNE